MRSFIINILKSLYPTYSVGQNIGSYSSPYLVVKYGNQMLSTQSRSAGWQTFEVMCYSPCQVGNNSILPVDVMLEQVKNALRNTFEMTGNITPDFLDTDVKCYMRSIEFKIPKEV